MAVDARVVKKARVGLVGKSGHFYLGQYADISILA
jgi:hypothetical protein